jgi:hypothetical protein
MHVFSADFADWKISVPRLGQAGYIVRAYVLDGKAIWGKALAAGVNMLSTDEVRGKTWARVGAEPFEPI